MAAQKLAALLNTTGEMRALAAKAERLAEWQRHYASVAPSALARASRIVGHRSGTILVWADNAAVATKLRQLAPRLVKALNQAALEVTSIQVRVRPKQAAPAQRAAGAKQALPPSAIAQFEALTASVPDPRLKTALANLVARHRARRGPLK